MRKALLLLFILIASPLRAEYPEIKELNRRDILFLQLQRDIEAYYRVDAEGGRKREMPPLVFFQYNPKGDEDMLSVAARLNLPYEALASLNGIRTMSDFTAFECILIPNLPGIFVPLYPQNDLEAIMLAGREARYEESQAVRLENDGREFLFFPGDRFLPLERAYFLRILFRFPLEKGWLTSRYGRRKDPFGGHPHFHNGIDIGADSGTAVLAAREGLVAKTGWDDTYGNFVLINHTGGYQTLYGHLSKVLVHLNQEVNTGTIVGKVGSTGRSTGPHLHFEIRKKGSPRDPVPLLPKRDMNDY